MSACVPWGTAGELAASRHGVLTRSQAASIGISAHTIRRLLRDGWLLEPRPGVLVVHGAPPTWRQELQVATSAGGGRGVGGFRSSAAIQRVDGYGPGPVELVVPQRARLPGVVQHEGPLDRCDIVEVDGIRCTNIARTLCDLGSVDPPAKVEVAFEWAWRNGTSLLWLRHTADRLHRPGQRGTRVMLDLLDRAAEWLRPTASALEVKVGQALAGIPGLVRQYEIRAADGRFLGRPDFAVPEARVAVEAHSREFHFGFTRPLDDADREADLLIDGWVVRFITNRQADHPRALRADIEALVAARLRPQRRSA